MTNKPLRVWAFWLGIPLGIASLAVGAAVVIPRATPAQAPPETLSDNAVPVRGATPQAARLRGRIPCESIISKVDQNLPHRLKGSFAKLEPEKGLENTVADIAQTLGTTRLWVVQCMWTYGRRVPVNAANQLDEHELEEYEEQEPEESAPEDLAEPGTRERDTLGDENPYDRHELEEKESILHPTPQR